MGEMKQVLQNLRSGETVLSEVPAPVAVGGQVVIRTRASLISAGTEKMLVEFGKAGLIAKAKAQPDKVKQVLDKIKTDGLMPTLEAVFNRLDEPLPLGYCNVGEVVEVGTGVTEFAPGDRVVSNGAHAEYVSVGKNLCAKVPEGVSDESAAFTVLASIGLQGIRLAEPSFGERVVVYGLGLIGLVTVQLLLANGCEVLGVDVSEERLSLAASFGARTVNAGAGGDPVSAASAWTSGRGVDAVLITASAKTDEIVHNAAEMCRKRGRIVLVGVVGLNLRRNDFYEKELSFRVSCSYGPGRYDDAYEQGGVDYPEGFVRWTEGRNFEAILSALAAGRLDVGKLITHRLSFSRAPDAYELLSAGEALGVVLEYAGSGESISRSVTVSQASSSARGSATVGVIGAGNFSKMTLMPALAKTPARIKYVADLNGAAAKHLCGKFSAERAITDYREILSDDEVDAVLIAVGHSLHCRMVCESLEAGKHAFVEKPLAMNVEEVRRILSAAGAHGDLQVTVGFNRRFSPHVVKMKSLLSGRSEPLAMNMTVNAGIIPPEVWVHDPVRGGGRIIGEGCHFIDLLSYLAGSRIERVASAKMSGGVAVEEDKMSIVLSFEDGSVGTVNYFGNGSKSYPKEMLEVFSEGRVLRLDNFRRLEGHGFSGFRKFKTSRQDKGHGAEFSALVERISAGGAPLIGLEELVNVTLASFAAMDSSATGRMIELSEAYDLSAEAVAGVREEN
jgi:predicted dehydrogenase/NADPH:quinone reductase-like Zn-dependent oxidoreductase